VSIAFKNKHGSRPGIFLRDDGPLPLALLDACSLTLLFG
jgi:hypothetical protein